VGSDLSAPLVIPASATSSAPRPPQLGNIPWHATLPHHVHIHSLQVCKMDLTQLCWRCTTMGIAPSSVICHTCRAPALLASYLRGGDSPDQRHPRQPHLLAASWPPHGVPCTLPSAGGVVHAAASSRTMSEVRAGSTTKPQISGAHGQQHSRCQISTQRLQLWQKRSISEKAQIKCEECAVYKGRGNFTKCARVSGDQTRNKYARSDNLRPRLCPHRPPEQVSTPWPRHLKDFRTASS
jgi:hypothetical protein